MLHGWAFSSSAFASGDESLCSQRRDDVKDMTLPPNGELIWEQGALSDPGHCHATARSVAEVRGNFAYDSSTRTTKPRIVALGVVLVCSDTAMLASGNHASNDHWSEIANRLFNSLPRG